jgi:2-iminobutanoate/2-iminopropanoate deaminase
MYIQAIIMPSPPGDSTMLIRRNAAKIPPPLGRYTHAVEVPAGARQLHVSGQVAMRADGSIPEGIEAQLICVWENLLAILHDAGMDQNDITRVNTYITKAEFFAVHPRIRATFLGDACPAATTVCVTALANPDFLCEIELTAAKQDGRA